MYLVVKDEDKDTYFAKIYKHEMCKFRDPFLSYRPLPFFIGESRVCRTTEMPRAPDGPDFDGSTWLIISVCSEYVYIFAYEMVKFYSDDRILNFISLMGNNMIQTTIAVGQKYTYVFSDHCIFIEKNI